MEYDGPGQWNHGPHAAAVGPGPPFPNSSPVSPFDQGAGFVNYNFNQQQPAPPQSRRSDDSNDSDDDDAPDPIAAGLNESPVSDEIVTEAPAPRFRLTTLDVVCLVLNRMIGSGIFMTPHKVMEQTKSTGVALLFWFAGVLYALAGMHIYIEYGLNVPRVLFGGREQSVPRSGGDLNYVCSSASTLADLFEADTRAHAQLQYVYRWLGYRGQTVLPITCLFGIAFVVLGNMAGNCINFAIWIVRAADQDVSDRDPAVRGIALGLATLSCFIHATSRRGGILLNDVLAVLKVMILLLIIVTAIIVAAAGDKVFPHARDHFSDNMNVEAAFDGASGDPHSYASAFLSISMPKVPRERSSIGAPPPEVTKRLTSLHLVFTYSGFEQSNYVLGEIGRPRQRFPRGIALGTIISCVLYMVTNIAYVSLSWTLFVLPAISRFTSC